MKPSNHFLCIAYGIKNQALALRLATRRSGIGCQRMLSTATSGNALWIGALASAGRGDGRAAGAVLADFATTAFGGAGFAGAAGGVG